MRFAQSVLNSAEVSHDHPRHRVIWVVLESFEEQLFGSRAILFKRAAPSVSYIANQDQSDANPRIDRPRVDL